MVENKYQGAQCVEMKGVLDLGPLPSEPQGCADSIGQCSPTSIFSAPPPTFLSFSDLTSDFEEEGRDSPQLSRDHSLVLTSEPLPMLGAAGEANTP